MADHQRNPLLDSLPPEFINLWNSLIATLINHTHDEKEKAIYRSLLI